MWWLFHVQQKEGGLRWSQEAPLGCKVASSTAKEEDNKMTRARGPKLFCAPFLQPDSWSMSSSDYTNALKIASLTWGSASPTNHPVEGKYQRWPEMGQNGQQRVTPAHCQWVHPTTKALFIFHLQWLGWHLALGCLYAQKRLKETNALAKIHPPAICTAGNALWKAKEEDPSPCMLLGEWCNLQQLPALPCFILIPLTQIQTCFSPPTCPHGLCPRGMNSLPAPVNFSEYVQHIVYILASLSRGLGVKCRSRNIFLSRKQRLRVLQQGQ